MNKLNVLCVGGDARMIYTCEKLCESMQVYAYKTKARPKGALMLERLSDMSEKADVLVLPMLKGVTCDNGTALLPCSDGNAELNELADKLSSGALVVGGLADESIADFFTERGHQFTDYFNRSELIVKNCIPTAEGALMLAMQELATTVFGARVLITGYGNVAKAAARLFAAVGAEVSCAVRKPSAAAEAESNGHKAIAISSLDRNIDGYDIIINTVPALIIGEALLERIGGRSLVIDLASAPGGVDKEAASRLGTRYIHALALPGKVAPVTAGRYIAEAVENIISERGI